MTKPRHPFLLSPTLPLAVLGMVAVAESFAPGLAIAQQPPSVAIAAASSRATFEVATIKLSDPLNSRESISIAPGGRLSATVTVKSLIERAYGIRDFQIAGGPKWLDSTRYDIVAESDEMEDPGKLTPARQDAFIERQEQRLQSLLADRFQLSFHQIQKQMPVYALVVAKGGPKLQSPKPGELHRLYTQSPGRLACFGASMPEFVAELPDLGVSRSVLDKTGLSGRFDFTLQWTPDEALDSSSSPPDTSGGSLFTALQEQLGLKLKPQRGPVEMFVIDHVERPSAN